jgi:Uma2 family endonuclease
MSVLEIARPTAAPPEIQLPEQRPGEAPPRKWRWTGDDLIRMGEAGLLPPEGRFELLDGEIYELMPPGPLHSFIVELSDKVLELLAQPLGAHSRAQNPIRLNSTYNPQPDVAVVRGVESDYRERFPDPGDVLWIVEVADSSLEHDRTQKLPAYAEAGILECWVVNLPEQQVEVYREPAGREYRMRRIFRSGEAVEPLAAPGALIAVAGLLGEVEDEPAAESSQTA